MSANTLLRSAARSTPVVRNAARAVTGARGYAEAPKPNLGENRPIPKAVAKDDKSAFRAQLYESTAERTKKERADRDRHARERQEGGGGRNIATTFGMLQQSSLQPHQAPGTS